MLTCCEYPLLLEPEALDDLASCDPLLLSPDILFWSCDVANPILEPVFDEGRETPTAIWTKWNKQRATSIGHKKTT